MSYLVLNRRNKRDCNFLLPYYNCFYAQTEDALKPKRLYNENYKDETNIFVANDPVSNQHCPLPNRYSTVIEDQTNYLKG